MAEFAVNIGSTAQELSKSAFMKGYQAVAGRNPLETPAERRRFSMYKAYLAMIMVIECAPRAYPLPLHTWIKTYVYQILQQTLQELETLIE